MTHKTKPNRRTTSILALLALSGALAATTLKAEPRTVKGVVLDAQGKPIRGATVRITPSLTGGEVKVKTDARGQYRAEGLINMPYTATAWVVMAHRDEKYCMRVDNTTEESREPFSGAKGAIRDFKLRLSGPIEDADMENAYFGGEVRLLHPGWDDDGVVNLNDSRVEVTLVPDGPLLGGAPGKTLVRTTKSGDQFLYDIPVGVYKATAVELRPDGTRAPLLMGERAPAPTMTLSFKGNSNYCGSGYGVTNGIERAFLWIARPGQ